MQKLTLLWFLYVQRNQVPSINLYENKVYILNTQTEPYVIVIYFAIKEYSQARISKIVVTYFSLDVFFSNGQLAHKNSLDSAF